MTEEEKLAVNTALRKSYISTLRTIQSDETCYGVLVNALDNLNREPLINRALDSDIQQLKQLLLMIHITSDYFANRIAQTDYLQEE